MIFLRARRNLMLIQVLAMLAIIAVLDGTALSLMDRVLMAEERSALSSDAGRAAAEILEESATGFRLRHGSYGAGTFYVVWDGSGHPIFNPDRVATGPLRKAALSVRTHGPSTVQIELPGDQDVIVRSLPVTQVGGPARCIQVGRSLNPIREVEQEALVVASLATGAALLVAIVASWFIAGWVLVPIRRAMEQQRDFTADASHELRTPLTVIDTGIQVLRRHPDRTVAENEEELAAMGLEAGRMGRILSGLLALARADSGQIELDLAEIDVGELARSVARDMSALAAAHRAELIADRIEPVRARVDADRVRQLMVILLDNALSHGLSPIELRCGARDGRLVMEVSDRGRGIPAGERERVFERFHRAGQGRSRTGAGLGLPIARWIVRAHRGTITLSDAGPGLRVHVELPLDRGAHPRRLPPRSGGLLHRLRNRLPRPR